MASRRWVWCAPCARTARASAAGIPAVPSTARTITLASPATTSLGHLVSAGCCHTGSRSASTCACTSLTNSSGLAGVGTVPEAPSAGCATSSSAAFGLASRMLAFTTCSISRR
eukprot:4731017-Pyramimonas_sp.AAC.1